MKTTIILTTLASFMSATSAVQFVCYGHSGSSNAGKGGIEYALRNRATDLGIPGGTKFSWRWVDCPNNEPLAVMELASGELASPIGRARM
ncbi:hypothetical protein C8035_v003936 [Colletotrichum spinosum]|uniref:Uncharacterized protein n=1 Tax=Colletotrichum spinosum TaxID=1347390 RepID=A0A4R8PT79_9PEZI|nr:hypothetical protein C8035_v003936 [Colletotrichum spinosum]